MRLQEKEGRESIHMTMEKLTLLKNQQYKTLNGCKSGMTLTTRENSCLLTSIMITCFKRVR